MNKGNLTVRQQMPLELKIRLSEKRIREWYAHFHGQVYVSFSGGKDSRVLLHLVRNIYPDVPALFVDTGLEYPEIRDFVKTIENVIWLKPKKSFKAVIEEYGYPVISKKVAMGIDRYRNTKSDHQKELRLYGGTNPTSGKKQKPSIPKKWEYLLDAPFKISEKCCYFLKKEPIYRYNKETGRVPYIGMMASDSDMREQQYLATGCNAFDKASPSSTPLGFWMENDIWQYLREKDVDYSSIYDMGYLRTGCMFCMFGCHMQKIDRFEMMKQTHPKQYDYCMDKLGIREVLRYVKNHENNGYLDFKEEDSNDK